MPTPTMRYNNYHKPPLLNKSNFPHSHMNTLHFNCIFHTHLNPDIASYGNSKTNCFRINFRFSSIAIKYLNGAIDALKQRD